MLPMKRALKIRTLALYALASTLLVIVPLAQGTGQLHMVAGRVLSITKKTIKVEIPDSGKTRSVKFAINGNTKLDPIQAQDLVRVYYDDRNIAAEVRKEGPPAPREKSDDSLGVASVNGDKGWDDPEYRASAMRELRSQLEQVGYRGSITEDQKGLVVRFDASVLSEEHDLHAEIRDQFSTLVDYVHRHPSYPVVIVEAEAVPPSDSSAQRKLAFAVKDDMVQLGADPQRIWTPGALENGEVNHHRRVPVIEILISDDTSKKSHY